MSTFLRLSLAGLLFCLACLGAKAIAADCEPLLVPDALPWRDTTIDLAYLATIDAENFSRHRTNAIPKLSHAGIPLPIASDLLLHAADFGDFATLRAQRYAEHHFDYP